MLYSVVKYSDCYVLLDDEPEHLSTFWWNKILSIKTHIMCKCNKIQEEHPPFGSGLRLFFLERFISMLLAGRLTAWLDNVSTLCKSTALGKISLIQHRMDFKTRLGLLHTSVLYTDRFDVPWNTITEIQRMCTPTHTHTRARSSITCTFYMNIWVEAGEAGMEGQGKR